MSWKVAVGNSAEPVVRKSGGATGRQFNGATIQRGDNSTWWQFKVADSKWQFKAVVI